MSVSSDISRAGPPRRRRVSAGKEARVLGQNRILEMVATGAPLAATLDQLMLLVEAQEPGMRCAILIVTDDGAHFRRGAGPNLPEIFLKTLDGVPITPPYLGSCGEAAHMSTVILCPDIEGETRYPEDWRKLILACGVRAMRSTPVYGTNGRVLGSISMHFDEQCDPTPAEPDVIAMATHLAAIAIERDHAARAFIDWEKNLSNELAAMRELQSISTSLIQQGDVQSLYQQLVTAAKKVMRSDTASFQILDRDSGSLRLAGWEGFDDKSAAAWEWVGPGATTSCAQAMKAGQRIVIADIATAEKTMGSETFANYKHAGLCAMQSTPLFSRSGELVGMISTHWYEPTKPSDSDLRRFDVLARQAADLVERTQAELALQQAKQKQQLLIGELNHRVKNTLAMVQSVASQTLRHAGTLEEGREAFEARLIALSKAHDILTREQWETVRLHDVVEEVLAAHSSCDGRCQIEGPEVRLQPKFALALSMGLHELVTNAVKHGALSVDEGAVKVSWIVTNKDKAGAFRLQWVERNGPPVSPPRKRSFGSWLIEQGLAHDLGAKVKQDFAANGLVCTIEASLAGVTASHQ